MRANPARAAALLSMRSLYCTARNADGSNNETVRTVKFPSAASFIRGPAAEAFIARHTPKSAVPILGTALSGWTSRLRICVHIRVGSLLRRASISRTITRPKNRRERFLATFDKKRTIGLPVLGLGLGDGAQSPGYP